MQLQNIQTKQNNNNKKKTSEAVSSVRWKTNQVIFYKRNPKSRGGPTMASKTMTITMTLRMMVMQPRSQGSLLPALRSERERETLENAGHVALEQN